MTKHSRNTRLYETDLWSAPSNPIDLNALRKRDRARHAASALLVHYPQNEGDHHLAEALVAIGQRNRYAGLEQSGRGANPAAARSAKYEWGNRANARVAAYLGMPIPSEGGRPHELASAFMQFDVDFGETGEDAQLLRQCALRMILDRSGVEVA